MIPKGYETGDTDFVQASSSLSSEPVSVMPIQHVQQFKMVWSRRRISIMDHRQMYSGFAV